MILDTWNLGPLGSYIGGSGTTIILGTVVWLIRKLVQDRRATRNPKAPAKAQAPTEVESRVEYFRLLMVLLILLAALLGVLLLAVASLLQPSLPVLALSIAAGVITVLLVMTALMLGIVVPTLKSFWKLEAEVQVLKKDIKSLGQNQQLDGKGSTVEELPPRKDNVPKTKSRRRALKPVKADAGD